MKAWLFVNFLGACLLLANVSISTAEQRNIRSLEHDNFNQDSFKVNFQDGTAPKTQKLYKVGDKSLVKSGEPYARHAINCSSSPCPAESACGSYNVCWCGGDSRLRFVGGLNCIDIKKGCDDRTFRPCHQFAECQPVSRNHFGCKCKKKYEGNGVECKRKAQPTTKPTKTSKKNTLMKRTTPARKRGPTGVFGLVKNEAKSAVNKAIDLLMDNVKFVILGGIGFVLLLLFFMCLCCRRCARKRIERKLNQVDYEGQGDFYTHTQYQNVPVNDYFGPLPPTPTAHPGKVASVYRPAPQHHGRVSSVFRPPPQHHGRVSTVFAPPPPHPGMASTVFASPPPHPGMASTVFASPPPHPGMASTTFPAAAPSRVAGHPPPPTPAPPPAPAPPPPPPPPPPMTAKGHQPKGTKTVSQSSFYSDDEN